MKKASASCKVHGENTQNLLKENCLLQHRVFHLQKQLEEKRKNSPLTSVENTCSPGNGRKKFRALDIKDGLQLRFACGTSGFNVVRDFLRVRHQIQLPSVRQLQLDTQHLKFAPGLLEELFPAMKSRMDSLPDERDRDVNLVFDEFSMKMGDVFDPSLKRFLGRGTLPGHEKMLAEKCELFLFRGCHRKFKQLSAYHFNPAKVETNQRKEVILDLLQKVKECGGNTIALVCDMGNRGLLSALGFCTKKNALKYCIPNPVSPEKKLWCVPDPVHVFKAVKECLCSNRYLELAASVVSEFDLPSVMVDLGHIEWMEKFQRNESLVLVPGLTLKDFNSTHFSKMKVKSSHKVINHKVSSSLSYLVLKGVVPTAFETTAWFIKLVNRWFGLLTSRSCSLALGRKDEAAYQAALDHLRLVITVFEGLKIPGGWKPVQSHIIFCTKSMLEIQDHLINERNYQFLFTGNFTSDVAENAVSMIRMTNSTPNSVEVKNRLKHICISNFNRRISNSSYDHDDAQDLVELLLERESCVPESQEINDFSSFKWSASIPLAAFKSHVLDVLYRMCGYVIVSLKKRKVLACNGCIEKLQYAGESPHPNAMFVILTDYVPGAQFQVSDMLFRLLQLVEYNLLLWCEKLRAAHNLELLVDAVVKPAVTPYFPLGTCHDIKMKIVKAFCVMRFKQLGVHVFRPEDCLTSTCLSSKSAGEKYLASNYRNTAQKKAKPASDITPKIPRNKLLKRLLQFP
jgi:hypothetical protein